MNDPIRTTINPQVLLVPAVEIFVSLHSVDEMHLACVRATYAGSSVVEQLECGEVKA